MDLNMEWCPHGNGGISNLGSPHSWRLLWPDHLFSTLSSSVFFLDVRAFCWRSMIELDQLRNMERRADVQHVAHELYAV